MLEIRIDKCDTHIEASGTISDITSELLVAVKILRDKFEQNDMGDLFLDGIRFGLDFVQKLDTEENTDVEAQIDELVEKALEDDDILEIIMDMLPDPLKADFAKRMKDKAKANAKEEK